MKRLFDSGALVATRAVADRMNQDPVFTSFVHMALTMHLSGNWGDVCDEDWETNQEALKSGARLFSAYWIDDNHEEKIWIITESDRSSTTVLFPSDY